MRKSIFKVGTLKSEEIMLESNSKLELSAEIKANGTITFTDGIGWFTNGSIIFDDAYQIIGISCDSLIIRKFLK